MVTGGLLVQLLEVLVGKGSAAESAQLAWRARCVSTFASEGVSQPAMHAKQVGHFQCRVKTNTPTIGVCMIPGCEC